MTSKPAKTYRQLTIEEQLPRRKRPPRSAGFKELLEFLSPGLTMPYFMILHNSPAFAHSCHSAGPDMPGHHGNDEDAYRYAIRPEAAGYDSYGPKPDNGFIHALVSR